MMMMSSGIRTVQETTTVQSAVSWNLTLLDAPMSQLDHRISDSVDLVVKLLHTQLLLPLLSAL